MQEAMGWRKPSWRRAQICSPYVMLCLCTHRPQTPSSRPLYAHRLPRVRPKGFGSPPPLPNTSLPLRSQCSLALRGDPGTSLESPSNSDPRIYQGNPILSPTPYQTGKSQRPGKCAWDFFSQMFFGQCMFIELKEWTLFGRKNPWGSLENEWWRHSHDS